MKYFDGMTTPVGRIHIVVTDSAIVQLHLPNMSWTERYVRAPKHPLINKAKRELAEYFSGERRRFSVPLAPEGTTFQKKTWAILSRIPYGQTLSYSDESRLARAGKAVRAIANANGRNPIPIFIPCHRVVSKNGTLGGYSGGVALKRKLLALECGT
jgi:methylated-DNA-[protein]-cysteine S-methyltransferase